MKGEGKKGRERGWIWLIYFLCMCENRIMKPKKIILNKTNNFMILLMWNLVSSILSKLSWPWPAFQEKAYLGGKKKII
jgi:hypothetical protein